MTLVEVGSYTFYIRTLGITSLLALASCATESASRSELFELTAQVRALHAENSRLQTRVDKLEEQQAVALSRTASKAAPASTTSVMSGTSTAPQSATLSGTVSARDELPPLAVVKLKPKREPAPIIDTGTAVIEPPEGIVGELKASEPVDEPDPSAADSVYEHGVGSLKTGNVEGGVKELQKFAQDWPRHPHADNALYFAGLGQMALSDFEGAERTLQIALSKYPAGDAVLDCMLKLAECRVKLNRPSEARATWEKIITTFPGTAAATQAQARLASSSSGKPASPQ